VDLSTQEREVYKWVFTCFTYTTLGLYVLFSVGRDQCSGKYRSIYLKGVSDDYVYSLRNHTAHQ